MKPSTTKEQKLERKAIKQQIRLSELIKYKKQVEASTEKHCLKCEYFRPAYGRPIIGWRGYVCELPIRQNPQLRIKDGFQIAKECEFYSLAIDQVPF